MYARKTSACGREMRVTIRDSMTMWDDGCRAKGACGGMALRRDVRGYGRHENWEGVREGSSAVSTRVPKICDFIYAPLITPRLDHSSTNRSARVYYRLYNAHTIFLQAVLQLRIPRARGLLVDLTDFRR